MAEKTVGDLNIKVGVNLGGLRSELNSGITAWKNYRAAQDNATSAPKITAATSMFADQARSESAMKKLTGYDTAQLQAFSQASNHASEQTKKLWAAQIQAKVANNALAHSLGTHAGGAAGAVRNLGNTSADSLKGVKRFQLGVQNAGYQVQDFFVQVASGQSKMTALAQQLPQLLGPLGMWGALAGAGVAIGAVIAKMVMLKSETAKAAEQAKTLNDQFIKTRDLIKEAAGFSGGEDFVRARDEAEARKKIAESTAKIADAESRLTSVRSELNKVAPLNQFTGQRELPIVNRGGATQLMERERILTKTIGDNQEIRAQGARDLAEIEAESFTKARENENSLIGLAVKRISANMTGSFKLEKEEDARLDTLFKQAEAIRDQINPKRKLIEEQRNLNRLVREGIITQKEADQYTDKKRAITLTEMVSRLPQSLQITGGASALGGMSGSGTASALLDINKQILEGIKRLVGYQASEAMGAGL